MTHRPAMAATFVPIHAAHDGAWGWRAVAEAWRALGHDSVLVDLPAGDESLDLWDYADALARAIEERDEIVLVAHSFGAFTAPLVCERRPVVALVYTLTARITSPSVGSASSLSGMAAPG